MVFNPIISASGGLKPQIIVTAPTGTSVACITPGGITIPGVEIDGTWTFAGLPEIGVYTISATKDGSTKTQEVNIDKIGVYTVTE